MEANNPINDMLSSLVLDAAMQPEMSEREKALRDLFVKEYFVDYNSINAALRCGFMRTFAEEYAQRFMQEPYVKQKIKEFEFTVYENKDHEAQHQDFNKRRIMNSLFREAHYHGPGSSHSARVAALTKLAILHDMVPKPAPKEDKWTQRGGVIEVPGIATLENWEQAATNSQEALVNATRS